MASKQRRFQRQLTRLAADLHKSDPDYNDETGALMTEAETAFARMARARGKTPIRNGWPDFLVYDELSGGTVAVEVKFGPDDIRPSQARMFQALERAGITVMVWDPERPRMLQPWRRYHDEKASEQRDDSRQGPRLPELPRMRARR